MSLVSVADVRARVQSGQSDTALLDVITQEEAFIVKRFGAHYSEQGGTPATITETLDAGRKKNIFIRRPITSVSAIVEDGSTLSSASYQVWGKQGRIERLPRGSVWGDVVQVTYVPEDDNDLRRAVIIDLVRLAASRTGLKSESIGGEYSYTAEDWEGARANIVTRLAFAF